MTEPQAQPVTEQSETPQPAPAPEPALKMTRRHKRFVQEYLIDLSATNAAKRAGYSHRSAKHIGFELLKRPEVRAAIDRELAERRAQYPVLHAHIVEQLSNLAFADPRGLFDKDGRPKPIHELTPAQAASIAAIEVEETLRRGSHGEHVAMRTIKYRLAGKTPACELLSKVTGLLASGPGVAVQVNISTQPLPDDPHAAAAAYVRIINGGA